MTEEALCGEPQPRPLAPASDRPSHGVARRLIGRFALLAFALYHIPLLANDYPSLGWSRWSGRIFGHLGVWVARHVLGRTGPLAGVLAGDNNDTLVEYCRLTAGVVLAAIGAAIWTYADRRRPRAAWVEGALHVLLRYAIALGMTSYALSKIYPVQFGHSLVPALDVRLGEMSPLELLWHFMEYSRPYSTFGGAMELLAVGLLCFRRTATLGALVCLAAMTNVMLVNLCYGIDVKLFSTMIVVSSLALVAYDADALVRVLVLREAVPARPLPVRSSARRLVLARWVVKLVLVGGAIASSAIAWRAVVQRRAVAAAHPLFGNWEVTSQIVGGRDLAATAEPARWRLLISGGSAVGLRFEDGSAVWCGASSDLAARTLELTCSDDRRGVLRWDLDGDRLRLDGTFAGTPVTAALRRRNDAETPLLKARFAWTVDD